MFVRPKMGYVRRKIGLTGQFDRRQPGNYLQPWKLGTNSNWRFIWHHIKQWKYRCNLIISSILREAFIGQEREPWNVRDHRKEQPNKVVFCGKSQNLNCMVSFRWKHQEFIQAWVSVNVLNKINLRLDFSATTDDLHQQRTASLINKINAKNSRGLLTQKHISAYFQIMS